MRSSKFDCARITGIGVPENARAGIAGENALEAALGNLCALGNNDHAGVLRKTDANTAAGASWVSIHNGGGVGIGFSQHAGMVVVADGTETSKRRLERVLTNDPGMGILRHADAGYSRAIEFAATHDIEIPMNPQSRD